jgi:hypothetical protein
MPISINPKNVPQGWPRGIYHLRLESCLADEFRDGRFTLRLTAKVLGPDQYVDKPFYKTFFLGTQDDPRCEKEGWEANSFAVRDVMNMVKAAELPEEVLDDIDNGIDVNGIEVCIDIGPQVSKKDGKTYSNNVFGWYPVGTRRVPANAKPPLLRPPKLRPPTRSLTLRPKPTAPPR